MKMIERSNGHISIINVHNITKADLQPGSDSWKIYFTNGPVLDTKDFDTVEDAIKWFNDNIDQVKQ